MQRESSESMKNEVIVTSTVKNIRRFLNGTATKGQFSYLFGGTGRGKTFIARNWIENYGNAAYVRVRTGATQSRLRKQISEAIFNTESMRERDILSYIKDHPGFVLVIDECNHLITDSSIASAKNLDSIRDYHDEIKEEGGLFGVCFIFTEYSLERLSKCRINSFLQQFINRGDNHLQLSKKPSRKGEIIPTLNALLPEVSNEMIDAACQFKDIRSLHKRIAEMIEMGASGKEPISPETLLGLQVTYESGEWPED